MAIGLVTTARARLAASSATARSIDCSHRRHSGLVGMAGNHLAPDRNRQHGEGVAKDGRALRSHRRVWQSAPRGPAPSRARRATSASPSRTKGGIASRRRAVQASSVISGPIPAGSPRVSARGRSARAMPLRLARKRALTIFDEGILPEVAQQPLGADHQSRRSSICAEPSSGCVVALERTLAAHGVELDGRPTRSVGGVICPIFRVRHEQPRGLGQRGGLLVRERLHAGALDALGEVGASSRIGRADSRPPRAARRWSPDRRPRGFRTSPGGAATCLAGVRRRLLSRAGLARPSPCRCRHRRSARRGGTCVRTASCQTSCALMRSLSVLMLTPALGERGGEAVDGEIVLLRHVVEDLVHVVVVGGDAGFRPSCICSRSSISMSIAFLLQVRRGLLLRGNGEEALTLVDVVVGDRVVVDEHLDRDFLRRAAIGAADEEEGASSSAAIKRSQARHSTTGALRSAQCRTTRTWTPPSLIVSVGTTRAEHAGGIGRDLVGAEIFQREVHEEALSGSMSWSSDERPLIGHVEHETVVLIA